MRNLFVVGRPLPASEDVRRLAAAITGRPVPREQPGRVTRGATMRDGNGAAVAVHAYEDADLEAVRAAITDAELIQAIGRGRGINRGEADPLEVWLLAGDALVALPVDELARWEDVVPVAGPRERMAERGVVLESPADAARAYPDLFPSAEAAKKALQRCPSGDIDFGDISLWDISIGVCPRNPDAAPVQVRYRPRGRGQQTRAAWAHPARLPGLRAWLESALGLELAHYSVAAPTPEPDLVAADDQPGLDPSAFGLRRLGSGGIAPVCFESGLSVRLRAGPARLSQWRPGEWLAPCAHFGRPQALHERAIIASG